MYYRLQHSSVEPRFNEGSRDCENMFPISRFRFIEVLFHIRYFTMTILGEEYRSLLRGFRHTEVRYVEVPLYWGEECRSL